jgi:protein TonB
VLRSPEAARKTIEGDLDLPPLPTRPAGSATTGTVTPPRVSPRASAGGAGSTANAESPARPVTVAGPPGTTGGREGVSQEDVPTVVPPRRTRAVSPEYPAAARAAQVEGDVVLSAVVNPDGTVGPVSVLRSVHPLLDEAAKAAVLQYRYAPALQGSTPVAATVRVVISFQLN